MSLRHKIDMKIGSDMRERIGSIMLMAPFLLAILIAAISFLIHFPLPTLGILGFIGYYILATWLAT